MATQIVRSLATENIHLFIRPRLWLRSFWRLWLPLLACYWLHIALLMSYINWPYTLKQACSEL